MKTFNQVSDLEEISDDPLLYREMYSFLSYCVAEILRYGDEEDLEGHDFNVILLNSGEQAVLESLGQPEEYAQIVVHIGDTQRIICRYIFPTEIVFLDLLG